MRILHMSDLHFGIEAGERRTKEEMAARNRYLEELITGLAGITAKYPIDYIFITGDVAYNASKEDYAKAGDWLCRLSETCSIPFGKMYLCPGDHDMDTAEGTFREYDCFCRRMGFHAYELAGEKNYLTGTAAGDDINVICLNTVWFADDGKGRTQMPLGTELIKLIRSEKRYVNGAPVIVIMHHPFSVWNRRKGNESGCPADVHSEICDISDMILTGHTYEAAGGYEYRNHVYVCGNGSAFKNGRYYHNFHIYEIGRANAAEADCIRTVYGFNGTEWRRQSQTVKLEMNSRKESKDDDMLKHSFSVLWWMRIG